MSNGEESFPAREARISPPAFVVALRGYDKRQVDQHLSRVNIQLAALVGERDRAAGQLQQLAARLEQAQAEVTDLRQRPPRVDRASFRDLGPTVDEIMALAEKQATEITDAAAQQAAELRTEAEKTLSDAWQRAERLRTESEATHERAEQEAKRVNEQCLQQIEDARAEVEAVMEAARAQTQQEIQARNEALAQLQTQLDGAQQQLAQSRQEGAAAERELSEQQQRYDDLSQQLSNELNRLESAKRAAEAAERHATEVRARVQREAERVAQLAAAAVMAAAARGAETGEYPMVFPGQPTLGGPAREATDPAAGATREAEPATVSAAANGDGHGEHTADLFLPAPRPQRTDVPTEPA